MNARDHRRAMIADWLRAGGVGGQETLVERLAEAGVAATQATVSRDLEALGAVRVRSGYVLAQGLRASGPGLAAMLGVPMFLLRSPVFVEFFADHAQFFDAIEPMIRHIVTTRPPALVAGASTIAAVRARSQFFD